jgi:hypothetical protein
MRKTHSFVLEYPNVQASIATMSIHWHSRCHYKRDSASILAGTNNPPHRRAYGMMSSGWLAGDLCGSGDGPRANATDGRLLFVSPHGRTRTSH